MGLLKRVLRRKDLKFFLDLYHFHEAVRPAQTACSNDTSLPRSFSGSLTKLAHCYPLTMLAPNVTAKRRTLVGQLKTMIVRPCQPEVELARALGRNTGPGQNNQLDRPGPAIQWTSRRSLRPPQRPRAPWLRRWQRGIPRNDRFAGAQFPSPRRTMCIARSMASDRTHVCVSQPNSLAS